VVGSSGELVGVISTDDLLACLARELLEISSLVSRQLEGQRPADYSL
jgi:hypothetical protein